MHGRGECAWQGVCTVGVLHGRGHAWQEKRQLQWTVRILLECILVNYKNGPAYLLFDGFQLLSAVRCYTSFGSVL